MNDVPDDKSLSTFNLETMFKDSVDTPSLLEVGTRLFNAHTLRECIFDDKAVSFLQFTFSNNYAFTYQMQNTPMPYVQVTAPLDTSDFGELINKVVKVTGSILDDRSSGYVHLYTKRFGKAAIADHIDCYEQVYGNITPLQATFLVTAEELMEASTLCLAKLPLSHKP